MTQESKSLPPVFITYGWCRTAYTMVRSLGARGVEVHVGDTSGLAMSRFSRYCRSFTKLPDFFGQPEAYMDALVEALRATGAEVLFPCHEDVETVIRFRDRLPERVRVAVPAYEDWRTAEDKLDYIEPVRKAGCPVPETHAVRSAEELTRLTTSIPYPVVIKARIGNSAKGVEIVRQPELLESVFMKIVRDFRLPPDRWPTLQSFVPGTKVGVLGVYREGKHVSSIVFDIVRSKGAANFGTSTYRVTIDDPEILANSIKAMEALNWHGVVDMDWLRDEMGTARLIDINGRLGGATALTHISGMDMSWLWYKIALGIKDFKVPDSKSGEKARWILGDILGLLDALRKARWGEVLDVLKPQWGAGHDDFVWHDPLPFFAQTLDYLSKFFKSGGNMNPVSEGMVR